MEVKMKILSIFLIISFLFLVNDVFASSDCPFKVQGPKAIMDTCGIINAVEGYPLNLTFLQCNSIKVGSLRFSQNDGGSVLHKPSWGCKERGNILICNSNQISGSFFLEPITYFPFIVCDNSYINYEPHIKIYRQEYPTKQTQQMDNNKSITNIDIKNIKDSSVQVIIGNKNIQNVRKTSNEINFIKDFSLPIITGIIATIISKILIDKYFSNKKKKNLSKTKKPKF